MEKTVTSKKGICFHVISAVLIALSLCFSVFYFLPVALRTVQAFKDLGISFVYYIASAVGKGDMVTPTVNLIPDNAVEVLPFDPEIFLYELKCFGKLLVSKENVVWFFKKIGAIVLSATPVVCLAIPALIALGVLLKQHNKRYDKKYKEKYNKSSLFLRGFLLIEGATIIPFRRFLRAFIEWVREKEKEEGKRHCIYFVALALIWAYNLNLITIAVEAFAYIFYLPASLDVLSIFTQIAKLAMDLTVAVNFIPWWLWAILGTFAQQALREYVAYKKLTSYEKHNREFLQNHHGALFVTGKQRIGKTRVIVSMTLSQEQEFRDRAKEGLLKREKQFPFFPWQNVDKLFQEGLKAGKFPKLETCEEFARGLAWQFKNRAKTRNKEMRRGIFRHYREKYGYNYKNFLFDYDYKRYGIKYNDGLTFVSIFEAIEGYLKNLWLYAAPTSLIFSTFPIRSDLKWKQKRVFPKIDGNFFKRKPCDIVKISRWSHIADQDAFRLGLKKDPNNPQKDGFEAGILTEHEIGKERGNKNTNQGKRVTDKECNTATDGYENNIKMLGHSATVDNYTFFRAFYDDQRADALGADNRDLCDVCLIREQGKAKSALPCSFIEKALGFLVKTFYDKNRLDEKEHRVDNTLSGYIMRRIFSPIFHYLNRSENKYTVFPMKLKVSNSMLDEVLSDSDTYYVMTWKDHMARYATDGIKNFYTMKAKKSKVGLNDFECFDRLRMTVPQMGKVRSHFYDDIYEKFAAD